MGYTHYWSIPVEPTPEKWAELTRFAAKAIELSDVPVRWESDDDRPPALTDDLIRFNGVRGDGHETFYMTREPNPRDNFDRSWFCKTNRKPYDEIVRAILLKAESLGILGAGHDGDNGPEAFNLYQKVEG